jgi:hypothetical protein
MQWKKEYFNELYVWLLASVFLALIFAVKFNWPIISIEPLDILLGLLYSLIIFGVFIGAQKLVAYAVDCKTTTKLLSFRRYWFRSFTEHGSALLPFEFPAWILLPIVFAFANIPWFAILNFDVEPKASHVRHRWQNMTEWDMGKICIAGPLALMALGLIVRIFGASEFAFLCILAAFLALVPIGLGFKLAVSSRILWFFAFIFALTMLLLIKLQSTFAVIMIAVIFAALATLAYYVLYEK